MKKLGRCFIILAIILSFAMCKTVKYNYDKMVFGIENEGYSAPARVAFFTGIPYLIGIVICIILALYFNNKFKR